MITGIAIIIFYALLHLVEARLEKVVIEIKDYNLIYYSTLNRQEHYWSAVWASLLLIGVISLVSITQHSYYLIASALVTRRIFFDYALHLLLGYRPRKRYAGSDWWVRNFFIPIFGKYGRTKELIATLVIWAAGIVSTILLW